MIRHACTLIVKRERAKKGGKGANEGMCDDDHLRRSCSNGLSGAEMQTHHVCWWACFIMCSKSRPLTY